MAQIKQWNFNPQKFYLYICSAGKRPAHPQRVPETAPETDVETQAEGTANQHTDFHCLIRKPRIPLSYI